jgi:hypothetical protein
VIKVYRKNKSFNYRVYGDLLKQQQAETLAIARLSRALRLTQQSTVGQHKRIHFPTTINGKPEVEW